MIELKPIRCINCQSVGSFKCVDQYRLKPHGMALCEVCGFVTYPNIVADNDKLKEYYEEEYRDPPSFTNLCTGERKIHYHAAFLGSLFNEWKQAKNDTPVVTEIGAAFGMFLHWIRQAFPKSLVFGTELTTSFVRNAWHLYKIKLDKEFDQTIKYDLIASYKVAEHMVDFDLELVKYKECLKENGRLYISIPAWFGRMSNFGISGFSLEYYYHKNHINVWTRAIFENMLSRAGFEIVKENHTFYDDTYLCKRNDEKMSTPLHKEDPKDIEDKLSKILEASRAFDNGEFEKAITIWPNFPDAHTNHYEMNRAKFHKLGLQWIEENVCEKARASCPDSVNAVLLHADICMRYSQWEKALKLFEQASEMKPNDSSIIMNIAMCFRHLAVQTPDESLKIKFLTEARNASLYARSVSHQTITECTNHMMADNAKIPAPFESIKK